MCYILFIFNLEVELKSCYKFICLFKTWKLKVFVFVLEGSKFLFLLWEVESSCFCFERLPKNYSCSQRLKVLIIVLGG
jgi:hypothetical protein